MATLWSLIDPVELTGFIRETADNYEKYQTDSLAGSVPTVTEDRIDYVYQTQQTRVHEAAKFRAWDSSAPIIDKQTSLTRINGTLPPISVKSLITELDSVMMAGSESDIIDEVFANAAYLGQAIVDRYELQRGEAVNLDSVTISENGLILPALDFGRAVGNDKTPGVLWDVPATADILNDLKTWQKAHPLVDFWVVSSDIWFDMLGVAQIRDIVRGDTAATTTALVSDDQLRTVLSGFGIKPFVTYDREIVTTDDDGLNRASARVIPANRLIGLPNSAVGNVLMGITQEARDLGLTQDAAGIVAATMTDFDTSQKWTKASAVGLTVLGRTEDIVTSTVVT